VPYAVETSKLTKVYGGRAAVEGLNVTVEDREIFGLVGPNGAGKTTTVRMLTTLIRPTAGTARIYGLDIIQDSGKVRRIIGYLPQQFTADDTLTGYENLLFYAKLYGLPRETRRRRINEVLSLVGLEEWAPKMVRNYSGGMKRRIELGSVLLNNPKLLFLDEPTLGLDPKSRILIWDFLRKIRDGSETTILLTTNYMDEAERLCDRVTIIDVGKLVVQGSPAALKESLGGDVITLTTSGNTFTEDELANLNPVVRRAEVLEDTIRLVVDAKQSENAMPSLLSSIEAKGVEILSATVKKPTLDDVFTFYAGKTMAKDSSGEPRGLRERSRLMQAMRL
jgi:ABC-2 type transport system ATP-binding protein